MGRRVCGIGLIEVHIASLKTDFVLPASGPGQRVTQNLSLLGIQSISGRNWAYLDQITLKPALWPVSHPGT